MSKVPLENPFELALQAANEWINEHPDEVPIAGISTGILTLENPSALSLYNYIEKRLGCHLPTITESLVVWTSSYVRKKV